MIKGRKNIEILTIEDGKIIHSERIEGTMKDGKIIHSERVKEMDSAFKKHEEIIFSGYGTAGYIRGVCMNLYNKTNPCDLGFISNTDEKHFSIVMDLLKSYRANGENDQDFMRICSTIYKNYYADEKKKTFNRENLCTQNQRLR